MCTRTLYKIHVLYFGTFKKTTLS